MLANRTRKVSNSSYADNNTMNGYQKIIPQL